MYKLKDILSEEIQYFINEQNARKLFKNEEDGKWYISAEVGTFPIQEFGFKLLPSDVVEVYIIRTISQGKPGDVSDYGVYFPSRAKAVEKLKQMKNRGKLTLAIKRIKLTLLKTNNRGKNVSLVALKKNTAVPGAIVKVLSTQKELTELQGAAYNEVNAKELVKKMAPDNIMAYALGAYSFILPDNEEVYFLDWAEKIAKSYDISNPANKAVYNAVKNIGRKAKIIKKSDGNVIIKGRSA